jgi:FlaA1/EpsC-like NDP-sugar epimerase
MGSFLKEAPGIGYDSLRLMISWKRVIEAFSKPLWRWQEFLVAAALDAGVLIFAGCFVDFYLLQVKAADQELFQAFLSWTVMSIVMIMLLIWRNQYSVHPRYFGLHDCINISFVVLAVLITDSVFQIAVFKVPGRVATSEALLFAGTTGVGITAIRFAKRWFATQKVKVQEEQEGVRPRILIAGAGDTGELIVRELVRADRSSAEVLGFVDDDPKKQSLRIHGIPVLGTVKDIPKLHQTLQFSQLLIAMPSANGQQIRAVFEIANKTGLRVRTLPSLLEIANPENKRLLSQLRPIQIEDLLRRQPVQTNLESIRHYLTGERVLITGAGGSIGSEIARQVAKMKPEFIILVGKGENSIYEIEQELIQTSKDTVTYSEIADVRDKNAIKKLFEKYGPTVVFHAAAHKHVPLMEKNPSEAFLNNVVGTFNLAETAEQFKIKKFILISTDKAVKPSSIMGTTKRLCEMIVSSFGKRSSVEFAAVRFGNVLGSRGSLVPLLQAQIRRGGPVTVTHPEMTRFFMTIPEAAQLVLQAGAMGGGGEIFILDMGQPIKIIDIATELIRMHELIPGQDIDIKFTGFRPGEKLHEELTYDSEVLGKTAHEKISMVADEGVAQVETIESALEVLKQKMSNPDDLAVSLRKVAACGWESIQNSSGN